MMKGSKKLKSKQPNGSIKQRSMCTNNIGQDWSDLPSDLLRLICKKVTRFSDHIRFSSICKSWRSLALENRHLLPPQPPLLLFSKDYDITLHCLNPTAHKLHKIIVPEIRDKYFCGNFQEWLLTVTKQTRKVFLLDPFTRNEIEIPTLPSIQSFYHLRKIVFSSNPLLGSDYSVMCIDDYFTLMFLKRGDKKWTKSGLTSCYRDIIHYKRKFYAAPDSIGKSVEVFDLDILSWTRNMKLTSRDACYYDRTYFLEMSGDLYAVARKHGSFVRSFHVFRLDISEGERTEKWVEVKSVGDNVIFLSDINSMSFSALDLLECKANHIYYDKSEGFLRTRDFLGIEVFNINGGTIEECIEAFPIPMTQTSAIWACPRLPGKKQCLLV